jgi:3-deoxy-D-manno-octulosonic-acid transferase
MDARGGRFVWRGYGKSVVAAAEGRLAAALQIIASPVAAGGYIKLVLGTSTRIADPPDFIARAHAPSAHHRHVARAVSSAPGIYPREIPGRVMIARHDDAEGPRVLRRFGLGLIRGAGSGERRRDRGGGEAAHGAVASLREGFSIAMTADVPPGPARRCGIGIVTIASLSGCPIVPFAVASSRYRAVNSWDRMTFNLPFSKLGIVMGDPLRVPPDASREVLEKSRREVEAALDAVTAKAYALAGADMTRATPVPKKTT